MPRRPAKVTQSDIARALRAAKEAGAKEVVVDSDGVIRILLTASTAAAKASTELTENHWQPSKALQRYLKITETS